VTALPLTAEEFPGELGESFEAACAAVSVKPAARGYGLVLPQDEQGGRWTQVTSDARGVSSVQSIWNMGLECGYEPPDGSVVAVRPGWPVPGEFGMAGLGEPHDPAGVGDSVLRPSRRGTPGRRRGMADIIDGEWTDMRGRSMEDYIQAERQDAYDMGDTGPGPPPARLIDRRGRIPATTRPIRQSTAPWLARGCWPPPPGRRPGRCASARITRQGPSCARERDGWTVIGRTDGPVLPLTDALPGMPIGIDALPATARVRGTIEGITLGVSAGRVRHGEGRPGWRPGGWRALWPKTR
jgi:hypothetical protein